MGGRRVLIVDDDPTLRRLVHTVLEASDADVLEAANGQEALEVLAGLTMAEQPGVVVLDVMMPGITGVEVCRKIDTDRVRVLMLTARDDNEIRQACQDAGAAAFLSKPFSSLELLDAVEALL